MTTGFEDTHDELRSVTRDLLAKAGAGGEADGAGATPGTDGPTGDPAVAAAAWRMLAEAGFLSLEVPEAHGGAGATFAEVAVVLEEVGRAAAPVPYLGNVVLGIGALNLLAPNPARDELLAAVAAGTTRVAVALATGDAGVPAPGPAGGGDVGPAPGPAPFRVEPDGGGLRLSGRAGYVPDAAEADHLLLLAAGPDGDPVVVHVEPNGSQGAGSPRAGAPEAGPPAGPEGGHRVGVTAQPLLDATRRFGVVTASGVELPEAAAWRFAAAPAASARRLLDRAALALSCDSLGLGEAMLEATVGYAGTRKQFDRPIGSFQAVKHMCADMLVQATVSRELVAAAVRALATAPVPATAAAPGGPPASHVAEWSQERDVAAAVARAKSYVGTAAVEVVGTALQLHGGIGYTWESGVHAYLKRAALNRSLFGSPRAHRRGLAALLVAEQAAPAAGPGPG